MFDLSLSLCVQFFFLLWKHIHDQPPNRILGGNFLCCFFPSILFSSLRYCVCVVVLYEFAFWMLVADCSFYDFSVVFQRILGLSAFLKISLALFRLFIKTITVSHLPFLIFPCRWCFFLFFLSSHSSFHRLCISFFHFTSSIILGDVSVCAYVFRSLFWVCIIFISCRFILPPFSMHIDA